MANHVYPELVRAMARGELADLQTLTWVLQCYDNQTYAAADLALADLVGTPVGDPITLTSVAVVVGAAGGDEVDLTCDDDPAYDLTGVAFGVEVDGAVVYIDTGSAATSTLAAFYDRRADTSALQFDGTGDTIALSFPLGYFIRL